ncbi:ATP-binding cassette domain-containing protein [Exiguobacterium sp. TBG-PICH-001]|uniref:ATP-binding cassette domain-containing protein n=1 Tax=Exiguobacterium abrahamii TaxID=2785532 RepID=UPI0018A6E6A0|nr:ATP-binding cassette domain-containing protein [Exiguobacterium sp. TBG-PICH-001]MBF8153380.1 ATP-binding cassette domain-containing protein [Exiguobacterium sp. TBG-PICH-001]
MIQLQHLSKSYRKKQILHHVSLEIEGIFGLLGPNGAGKTTLMKVLCGLTSVSGGQISIDGKSVVKRKYADVSREVGFLPQDFNIYPSLKVEDVLLHLALLQGITTESERQEKVVEALHRVNLQDKRDLRMNDLSGGMRRRVGIVQLLLRKPKILVFDEPTAGLDIEERIRFRNLLRELGEDHTIIISSHIVEDIEFLCTKIGILQNGIVRFEGTPLELKNLARGHLSSVKVSLEELGGWMQDERVVDLNEHGEQIEVRYLEEAAASSSDIEPKLMDGYLMVMRGLK